MNDLLEKARVGRMKALKNRTKNRPTKSVNTARRGHEEPTFTSSRVRSTDLEAVAEYSAPARRDADVPFFISSRLRADTSAYLH